MNLATRGVGREREDDEAFEWRDEESPVWQEFIGQPTDGGVNLHGVNPFVLTCQAPPGCSVHLFATFQCNSSTPGRDGDTVGQAIVSFTDTRARDGGVQTRISSRGA